MIEFNDLIVKIRYLHYPAKINDYCNLKNTSEPIFYNICFFKFKLSSDVKTMLIFVQSTPSNYKQRAVIRETCANRTNSKSLQVIVAMKNLKNNYILGFQSSCAFYDW